MQIAIRRAKIMHKICFWSLVAVATAMMMIVLVRWERYQFAGHPYPYVNGNDILNADTSSEPREAVGCSLLRKPRSLDRQLATVWQVVEDQMYYVYSAHADPRMGNATLIRIFGIMPQDRSHGAFQGESFWCQLWTDVYGAPLLAEAFLYNQGHAKEKYLSAQWSCVVNITPDNFSAVGVSLVVNKSCSEPTNMLTIHKVMKNVKPSKQFTICVGGALKREYSNYHQLVEWIEVNRMFGADHVIAYDYNSSEIIGPYVKYYETSGLLEIIPWSLPAIGNVENFSLIWNLGQITIINDCIYRSMYTSKYIVSLDLDEFIVPYGRSGSWLEMMNNAGCGDKPIAIVRNTFFGISTKWTEDPTYSRNKLVHDVLRLVTLTKTKQDKYVNFFPKRSKFITRSDVVDTAGIHNIKVLWGVKNRDKFVCEVKLPYGRLHHYRDPRWKDIEPIENTLMHKFADEIINRTSRVHKDVISMHTLA